MAQFERATALTFNKKTRAIVFSQKSKGPAFVWYQSLKPVEKAAWTDLKAAFLRFAVPVGYQENVHTQFAGLRQQEREYVAVFPDRVQAAQQKANMAALSATPAYMQNQLSTLVFWKLKRWNATLKQDYQQIARH